jgi:hypothetical protein
MDMGTTKNVNVNINPISTSVITDKERYLDNSMQDIDLEGNPYPESDVYTDPNAYYDERYDGIKGERRFNYQYTNPMNPYPNTTFPNNFNPYTNNLNQQISRPHLIEETKETSKEELDQASNSLGMDWDENHEARFLKWVMDQKSIRQKEERKLEEQWGLLVNERNSLEEQKRNIEAREAKLSEVKNLIPSAQQLKEMGAHFSQIQAFIYCVREKAAAAMIDERTAAWELVKDLELYNVIGGLQKAVSEKSAQLNLLSTALEQQKSAIETLVHLQKTGMTEEEISKLCMLVGRWKVGLGIGRDNGIKPLELHSHLNLPNQPIN